MANYFESAFASVYIQDNSSTTLPTFGVSETLSLDHFPRYPVLKLRCQKQKLQPISRAGPENCVK